MSKHSFDIGDDEIRVVNSRNIPPQKEDAESDNVRENRLIISPRTTMLSDHPSRSLSSRKRRRILFCIVLALVVFCVAAVLCLVVFFHDGSEPEPMQYSGPEVLESSSGNGVARTGSSSFAVRTDTIVDGVKLTFLTPLNATPVLEIGNEVTNDSSVVLAVQAADVRGDNGMIAGAFVVNGELLSKGESKAGFCSIVNGEITIGVADATPKFEEALTSGGHFFRQYPLVVGSQIVENKSTGKAKRKALAETDRGISVVASEKAMTFHDFSQALIDAGVRNAIYLVGGNSLGCYTDSSGRRFAFGKRWDMTMDNENYIVWR